MKTMKKIFALTLALMLVFSLALTANAVTETLTVDGALKGAIYNMYQMATVQKNETTGSILYFSTAAWEGFWTSTGEAWFDYNTTTKQVTIKDGVTDTQMPAAAKAAKAYAAEKKIEATKTATATGDEAPSASFSGVADGYYLMTSDKGSLCTLATIPTDPDENNKIAEKNETLPNITKSVIDAEVAIGDTVTFTLTVTTGENHNNEMNYIIHDTMSAGLTLNQDSIVVKYKDSADDTEEETLSLTTDYTVHTPGTETEEGKKCTFEIKFTDTLTTKANGIMTVTYTATVNEGATAEETNEASIDASTSTVDIYTAEFILNKTDGTNGGKLEGAQFKLYRDEACTQEIPLILNGTYYRPAVAGETAVAIVSDQNGAATVKGLDAGVTYYLKECQAPTGYVLSTTVYSVTPSKDAANIPVVTVENVKGEELPETGGMGTTLFYTLGGMMVAAAAVMLITKKRMSAM